MPPGRGRLLQFILSGAIIASQLNGRLSMANERHGKDFLIEVRPAPALTRLLHFIARLRRNGCGFGPRSRRPQLVLSNHADGSQPSWADCGPATLPLMRCGRTVSRVRCGWPSDDKVLQVFPFERGQFVVRHAESHPPPSIS